MNFYMQVDVLGMNIKAETRGSLINLNDVFFAGNMLRNKEGNASLQIASFLRSKTVLDYIAAAAKIWGIDETAFVKKVGSGNMSRTMVHISVAILAAEQLSPLFHAAIHKTFIEDRLLENRDYGASEFKKLNIALDTMLPDRVGKDNKGVFIQTALKIRENILGEGATVKAWDSATPAQTRARYEVEQKLVGFLEIGLVRDYLHLKSVIDKLRIPLELS